MSTLGPSTKAAIAQLVGTLPYLHAEGSAVPTAHRDFWQGVKAKYAASHTTSTGLDPKVEAAQAHAEEVLAKAIEQDSAPAPEAESKPAAKAEPAKDQEPEPKKHADHGKKESK